MHPDTQFLFDHLFLNKIVVSDARSYLRALPLETVKCIVTSPPYNLRNSTGGGFTGKNDLGMWPNQPMRHGYSGQYQDDMPHDEYVQWQQQCLVEMWRTLRRDGALFYNHKWRVQGGQLQRLSDEITSILPVRQIIIWNRQGGINFNDGYFLPSYELIYFIPKPDFKLATGTNTLMDVWTIPPSYKKDHPNAFPDEVARRCIESASSKGDLIIDPFMGSGTTAVMAKLMGREFSGCDLNPTYVDLARKRLKHPARRRFEESDRATQSLFNEAEVTS